MKNILLVSSLLVTGSLHAQYFYNDIIGTRETNRQMQTYIANKVNTVAATGYDQRGIKATDYSEYHEVKENGRALKASSIINLNKAIILPVNCLSLLKSASLDFNPFSSKI